MLLTDWLRVRGSHVPPLDLINLLEWLAELRKTQVPMLDCKLDWTLPRDFTHVPVPLRQLHPIFPYPWQQGFYKHLSSWKLYHFKMWEKAVKHTLVY